MVFLDVVYNHFGPDGNYLAAYAPRLLPRGHRHALGRRHRFPPARGAPLLHRERALLADGIPLRRAALRRRARHRSSPTGWTRWRPRSARTVEPGRHVHLVLENDGNEADHLRQRLRRPVERRCPPRPARPADRRGRGLLRRLCRRGRPSAWRAAWPKASSTRASPRPIARASRAARPARDLPPTAFVLFLQNHDQVGNRAVRRPAGRALSIPRRCEAAIALQLLCPQIPLIFMGEEGGSRTPFLFFTDHHGELAEAVREGRRREFAAFAGFHDGETAERSPIPTRSRPSRAAGRSPTMPTGARCTASCWRCAPLPWRRILPARARFRRRLPARPASPRAGAWAMARCWRWSAISAATDCAVDPPKGDLLFESRAGASEDVRARPPDGACHRRLPGPCGQEQRMNEEAVLARARAAGVAVDWTDAMGRPQRVRTESLRRLLEVARWRRCTGRRAAAGHGAPRPADRDRRHRRRPFGRAGAGRRRVEGRCHPRRRAARHRAAGLSPPALRRSRDHTGRGAAALRHLAGHRRRRADVGRGGAGLQPAPRRRWRHRRRRRRARSCRGGGASRRRRRGAQPGAQPVPARSGALRPLLAVEPAVPQSALRRSRRRPSMPAAVVTDDALERASVDRLARRRRRQVRPAARACSTSSTRSTRRSLREFERFVVEGGEALRQHARFEAEQARWTQVAPSAITCSCNGSPRAPSPPRSRRPRRPACASA